MTDENTATPTGSDPALRKLRNQRGGNIGYLKQVIDDVNGLIADADGRSEIAVSLASNRDIFAEKEILLKEYHEKIMDFLEEEGEIAKEIEHHNNFMRELRKCIHSIDKWVLEQNERKTCDTKTLNNTSFGASNRSWKSARLPKLVLHSFDGDPLSYQSFWDMFNSNVHSDPELDDISKFSYLKGLLEGKAKAVISGLDTTAENYKHAIELLNERFGDPQLIISTHMDTLLSLRPVTSNSVKELREIYDVIEVHTRNLSSFGISMNHYGPILNSIIMSKLTRSMKLDISRQMPVGKWDVVKLMDVFKRELLARERCESFENLSIQKEDSNTEKVFSSTMYSDAVPEVSCTYCKKGHPSNFCDIVTDVAARKAFLRNRNMCFLCLKKSHTANSCFSQYSCFHCRGRHHISICDKKVYRGGGSTNSNPNNNGHAVHVQTQNNTLLQTAKASAANIERMHDNETIRVLFDNGSQKCFITSALCERLKLKSIRREFLAVKTFGNMEEKVQQLNVVNVKISSLFGKGYCVIEAYVVPIICAPISSQSVSLAIEKYRFLKSVQLADGDNFSSDKSKNVDILIGANYYWSFTACSHVRLDNDFVALETILGWILSGSFHPGNKDTSVHLVSTHVLVSCDVTEANDHCQYNKDLERFWEIEEAGSAIQGSEFNVKNFLDKISWNEGRYTVPLPWKSERSDILPDNYTNSVNRLRSSLHRLKKTPELFKEYDNIIKIQEHDNIIEKVTDNHKPSNVGEVHYLPHHGVLRPDKKTSKLRVVYDASSNSPSLNDMLENGPCMIPLILDILIRFRAYKVALTSDIQQAYLNVEVNEEDRNFLRFLWIDSIDSESPNLVTYRFTRVLFGMGPSQFLLAAVVLKHLENYTEDPDFIKNFLRDLYVDDLTSGEQSVEKAFELYLKSKYRMLDGGFTLRKWRSSDPVLHEKIVKYENSTVSQDENLKVLGVPWNHEIDQFCLKLSLSSHIGTHFIATKRNVLRVIATIFDPIGFLSPVTVIFKMFFQILCVNESGWDEPLGDNLKDKWFDLVKRSNVVSIEVPRYYFGTQNAEPNEVTLHGFCDASKRAYAAVIYMTADVGGRKIGQLVACKTKVAPIKTLSIPQLELSACLLLSKLFLTVTASLEGVINLKRSYLWCDAIDCLFWIKGDHRKRSRFVENRVKAIRKAVSPYAWRHIPGKLNPADFPSRGCESFANINQKLKEWTAGPDFICESEDNWPKDIKIESNPGGNQFQGDDQFYNMSKNSSSDAKVGDVQLHDNNEIIERLDVKPCCNFLISSMIEEFVMKTELVSKEKSDSTAGVMVNIAKQISGVQVDAVINCERYSSYDRLLRVTAYVRRFIFNLVKKDDVRKEGCLTVADVTFAEIWWIQWMQKVFLNSSSQFKWLKKKLGIYLDDDNILRCKGRLNNSMLTANERNPILLPKKRHLVTLIIRKSHLDLEHGTIKDTLASLRSKYWVLNARKLVVDFIGNCSYCRRLDGPPFKSQEAAQLPSFRVCQSFPFTNTGVDYAGPFMVKQVYDDKDTSEMYKVHVVLYTCAATRAVHLDIVPNIGSSAFLRSLKRFIARRGVPNLMISDNATCFKSDEVRLSEELLRLGVKWKFIVEASPWWGGFWERLVRSVKRSLNRVIFRASLNYEEFLTVVLEIEGMMNSRPLTYIDSDVEEILTPGHLLLGRRILGENKEELDENFVSDKVYVTKRAKYLKLLSDHYWGRWKNEYLLELRNAHIQNGGNDTVINVGEVVVINEQAKRNLWRLGVITKLIESGDKKVRAVVLRTSKNGKVVYLRRPIEKLYPLEIRSQTTVNESDIEASEGYNDVGPDDNQNDENEILERPRRTAASNGILIRRLMGY